MTTKCFECGRRAKYEHHVVPRIRGGTQCVWLCGRCHSKAHCDQLNMSISSLTKEAMDIKRKNNERLGFQLPYGKSLDVDGVHLKDDQFEISVIEKIKYMRNLGGGVRAIARRLNDDKIRSRGKQWYPTSVARIIKVMK